MDKSAHGLLGFCIGAFIVMLVIACTSIEAISYHLIGHTQTELMNMKKACEKDLPRSKECVPELKFIVKEEK